MQEKDGAAARALREPAREASAGRGGNRRRLDREPGRRRIELGVPWPQFEPDENDESDEAEDDRQDEICEYPNPHGRRAYGRIRAKE